MSNLNLTCDETLALKKSRTKVSGLYDILDDMIDYGLDKKELPAEKFDELAKFIAEVHVAVGELLEMGVVSFEAIDSYLMTMGGDENE